MFLGLGQLLSISDYFFCNKPDIKTLGGIGGIAGIVAGATRADEACAVALEIPVCVAGGCGGGSPPLAAFLKRPQPPNFLGPLHKGTFLVSLFSLFSLCFEGTLIVKDSCVHKKVLNVYFST